MPPRASVRRSARISSREPEQTPPREGPSNFDRPQLPALHGTPSSRRLYSYGSGAEPPKKPASGLHKGQTRDIGNAVQNALERHEREKTNEDVFVRPPLPQSRPTVLQSTEEPEETTSRPTRRPTFNEMNSARQVPGESSRSVRQMSGASDDSQRSFGMESDFFVDATIASTPGTTPAPSAGTQSFNQSFDSQPRQKNIPQQSTSRTGPSWLATQASTSQTAQNGSEQSRSGPRLRERPHPAPQIIEEEDEEETEPEEVEEESTDDESEEIEEAVVPNQRRSQATSANTRMPGRNRGEATRPSPNPVDAAPRALAEEQSVPTIAKSTSKASDEVLPRNTRFDEPSREAPRRANTARDLGPSQTNGTTQPAHDPRRTLNIPPKALRRPRLFHQTAPQRVEQRGFTSSLQRFPQDPNARLTMVQREARDAEEQLARERREQESEARRERWHENWAWFLSKWSLDPLRRRFTRRRVRQEGHVQDDFDENELDRDQVPLDWLQFFNPMTYVRMLVSLVDTIMDYVVSFLDRIFALDIRNRLTGSVGTISWVVAGMIVLLVSFMISHFAYDRPLFPEDDLGLGTGSWSRFGQFTNKIGSIMPPIPSFSWPFMRRDDDEDITWQLPNFDASNVKQFWEKYEKDIATLKDSAQLHRSSLKKLEKVVPSIVHMELKDGKPVIGQDFWHALRDLIQSEGSFLAMEKYDDTYYVSSEHQWRAIVSRLVKDPTFTTKINTSMSALEGRLDDKLSTFWDSWILNNGHKVAEVLGTEMDKIKSAGSSLEFNDRLTKIVKEQLQRDDTVVTRSEFLQHVKNEFAIHRSEINAELNELRPRVENLIQESLRLGTKDMVQGMSRGEIITLVNDLVRKGLADMNLEAMAKGKIHLHWDMELKNQVNYFGIGAGATVGGKYTSATYNPAGKGSIISQKDFAKGHRSVAPYPPLAALYDWKDEGDCWCAARTRNRRGNLHGAMLSVQMAHIIVPEQVVIEHILPGATTDPDARPKDIEVYAYIEDRDRLERVLAFSAANLPPTDDWNEQDPDLDPHFVKIDRFKYEGAELHDGVYVHQLSPALAEVQAWTDQVVVRATSNHGDSDHTCFYRVRLYGKKEDIKVERMAASTFW